MKKYFALVSAIIIFLPFSTVAATTPIAYTYSNDLSVGSSGNAVVSLQTLLISKGCRIPAISNDGDKGYFGSQTKTAVMQYQKLLGLPITGYVGPLTRAQLNNDPANYLSNINSLPIIKSMSTTSAQVGTKIIIYVSNVPQGTHYSISLNSGAYSSNSDGMLSSDGSYLSFNLPNVPIGKYDLTIGVGTGALIGSNSVAFTVVSSN